MKSFTLHKLDAGLSAALEKEATARGQSLNRTAQELLRSSLHLGPRPGPADRSEEFMALFGTWNAKALHDFSKATVDLGRVDPTDWPA